MFIFSVAQMGLTELKEYALEMFKRLKLVYYFFESVEKGALKTSQLLRITHIANCFSGYIVLKSFDFLITTT